MKLLFIKILLLIMILPALCLVTVKKADAHAPDAQGQVISAQTKAPIVGVWVKWTEEYGSYRYAQTDSTGTYNFTNASDIGLAQIEANMNTLIDATLRGVKDTPEWYDWGNSANWADHFSCGDNSHTFAVTPPVGMAGSFSSVTGEEIKNNSGNLKLPTIYFTPNGAFTAPTSIPKGTPMPTSVPVYSISGNVFSDQNINKFLDNGETNFASNFSISINPNAGSVTTDVNGSYTITNLPPGAYTVSYLSLPDGYRMTSPLNGPPPGYRVIVGPGCSTNFAPGASCQ
jgi:hypothetical protein